MTLSRKFVNNASTDIDRSGQIENLTVRESDLTTSHFSLRAVAGVAEVLLRRLRGGGRVCRRPGLPCRVQVRRADRGDPGLSGGGGEGGADVLWRPGESQHPGSDQAEPGVPGRDGSPGHLLQSRPPVWQQSGLEGGGLGPGPGDLPPVRAPTLQSGAGPLPVTVTGPLGPSQEVSLQVRPGLVTFSSQFCVPGSYRISLLAPLSASSRR